MGIPSVQDYDINAIKLKQPNVVDWKPDKKRCVLLLHDMQNYFLEFLPASIRNQLIGNCATLLAKARKAHIPVVYSAQCGDMTPDQRGLLKDFWGPGMSADKSVTAICNELAPLQTEIISPKWRYSAFVKSGLLDRFEELGRDQIIICGIYSHIGILATAIDAYSNDIEVFIAKNALADFSQKRHSEAIEYMSQCCAKVIDVDEVL